MQVFEPFPYKFEFFEWCWFLIFSVSKMIEWNFFYSIIQCTQSCQQKFSSQLHLAKTVDDNRSFTRGTKVASQFIWI